MRTGFIIILLFSVGLKGQSLTTAPSKSSLPEIQIPTPVVESFRKENPSVIPIWKHEGKYFRATYIDQATNLGNSILYNSGGKSLRRDRELEKSEYPQPVIDFYNKTYPGE